MQKSFVLYTEIFDTTQDISDEDFGKLMRAVFLYEKGENLPDMDPMIKMAFNFIKKDLDRNAEKYEQKRKACSEAGKKSAESRKCQKVAGIAGDDEATPMDESMNESTKVTDVELVAGIVTDVNDSTQTLTNSTVNVNDNADVNVNDNVFISKRDSDIQLVIDEFNARCPKLDKVSRITPSRRKVIMELLDTYSLDEIREAFDKINKSDYLCGQKKGGFKAPFDWLIEVDHFQRIVEGGYSCSGARKSSKENDFGFKEREYDYDKLMKEIVG